MILTVCPSPCIDVDIEVETLGVGMSNKIIGKRTFYTGKAINVAIGLARLNAGVFVTGFMYEENCSQFEYELHKEGIPYKFVWNKGRVRENYKIIDRRTMLTEIDDVSEEVPKEKQEELLKVISQIGAHCEAVIISGGLAKGMSPDFYYKVLSGVPSGVFKIADTEGERLKQALKCGLKFAKPNLEELERTLKTKITTKEELLKACGKIIDMGCEIVMVSLGKRGAVISDGANCLYCKSVNVAMNSTVGAGDGMVAAASNAIIKGACLEDILRSGVAGGTASVTLPDSISFSKEKYEEIFSSLTVQKIL